MFAAIIPFLRIAGVWLGRAAVGLFAVNEVKRFTAEQETTINNSMQQAQAAGMTESELKQLVAATTYDQVESAGKSPDDFWAGLSQSEKDALQFSPESLRRSMDRTKFGGIGGALLFVGALAAAGLGAVRGIPVVLKTLGKLATARNAGASPAMLQTIIEEGKLLGVSKVWVPGITAGILTAGGYYVSGLTNNMNDADLWGRIFLGQAADDYAKAATKTGGGTSSSSGGLTLDSQPRTIIRIVNETKPTQFVGTLFSAKLGKAEDFERKLDDEITDMEDLKTDVKLNVNKWLKSLPGRMGYSIVIRKDPVDEFGAQQSGVWATATLHITQLSGKIMPIDTILLGPVNPAVRLELAKQTKTIETNIEDLISSAAIKEFDIPAGIMDIFGTNGEKLLSTDTSKSGESSSSISTPVIEEEREMYWGILEAPQGSGIKYQIGPSDKQNTINNKLSEIERAFSKKNINVGYTLKKQKNPGLTAWNDGYITSPLSSNTSQNPVLSVGSKGEAVKDLQRFLNSQGENLTIDGDFGQKTEQALQRFQMKYAPPADGIVGPATWKVINNLKK